MPKVTYDNGMTLDFDNTPTPQDIEEAYNQALPHYKPQSQQRNIIQQKQERLAQGQGVSVRPNRVEPTFAGEMLRGVIKPIARLGQNIRQVGELVGGQGMGEQNLVNEAGSSPLSTYLGDIRAVGQTGKGFGRDVLDSVGVGADIASNLIGAEGVAPIAKAGFKGLVKQGIKQGVRTGIEAGVTSGFGRGAQEGNLGHALGSGAIGGLEGGAFGGALGGGGAIISKGVGTVGNIIKNKVAPTQDFLNSKLDQHIRDIFKGTTADVQKINDSAFKARKGLELLQKESKNINIPDMNAPLGSNISKPFDVSKSKPNEFLSGVLEMDKKIATIAKESADKASKMGIKIDISSAINEIQKNIDNGTIPQATGARMKQQIMQTQGDPSLVHDWVQNINKKYGKQYQRMTIHDTVTGGLADDTARMLRNALDDVVDRSGYAEAYGNNQELKKMLLAIAKKANKGVNFGDITSDAGIDLGISILTGNPAYMARTVANGLFRGIFSKLKNTAGLRSLRKAINVSGKLTTETRLPSLNIKPQPKKPTMLQLPAPKSGMPQSSNNVSINLGSRSQSTIDAQEISRIQDKINTPKKSSLLTRLKDQRGFMSTPYVEKGNLTTKILKDLEGKTTVSKQYILDATNRGELKQTERDIIRQALEGEGDTVNVSDFAKKVKAELLPLKRRNLSDANNPNWDDNPFGFGNNTRYENISLPDELRGNIKDYSENIYESPVATSAGETHFAGKSKNYFGHTRIEDMADNKTRRVIEVQSDLYQKGRLESEDFGIKGPSSDMAGTPEYQKAVREMDVKRTEASRKLQQYNDPTAHFRMIREEIKKAAQDGKTKLQFPTGETAMKIEGLGENSSFFVRNPNSPENYDFDVALTPEKLKVGIEVENGGQKMIITDVLGDGKFKAVQKKDYERIIKNTPAKAEMQRAFEFNNVSEQFDISGKVDTSNPIYKFYEKDVQKYLNKYGGKRIVDDQGVSWIEIPLKKEYAKQPVEAFGKLRLGALPALTAGTTGAGLAINAIIKKKEKKSLGKTPPKLNKRK